jgi:hypothetical protein
VSLPKSSESYPVAMLDALKRAHATGEVIIPTKTPLQMRLQFQGLRGALRKEGKGELADQVSFHVPGKTEPQEWFSIRLRSASPLIGDITAALEQKEPTTSAVEEAEASLNRILGGL